VTHRRGCGSSGGELGRRPLQERPTLTTLLAIIADDAKPDPAVHPDIAGVMAADEACPRFGNANATNKPKQKQWGRLVDGGII
jgi:hypothetical protein